MTKIIITGAKGRMGQALMARATHFHDIEVVGLMDRGNDLNSIISKGDVVIDFSSHVATSAVADACVKHKKAIVIGTTGHSDAEKSEITKAQSAIPMVWASNFSTGVNTLFWLTRKAAEILGRILIWKLSRCIIA
jgi:4-hydroxy-tetrahydrodipicolinate reductase